MTKKYQANDDLTRAEIERILNTPAAFVKPHGDQWAVLEITPIESFIDDVVSVGTAEAGHNLAVILGLVGIDDEGDQDA